MHNNNYYLQTHTHHFYFKLNTNLIDFNIFFKIRKLYKIYWSLFLLVYKIMILKSHILPLFLPHMDGFNF